MLLRATLRYSARLRRPKRCVRAHERHRIPRSGGGAAAGRSTSSSKIELAARHRAGCAAIIRTHAGTATYEAVYEAAGATTEMLC